MIDSLLLPLFQPILDKDGRTFAYEALMRFKNHSLSPAALIKRWEKAGQIHGVDMAMVRRIGDILVERGTRPRIALNASIVTIETAGDEYLQSLRDLTPAAAMVIVELTETADISDHSALRRFHAACRGSGIAVALDDCRPGHLYGDPLFLASFRPHFVKIDGLYLQACHQAGDTVELKKLIAAAHTNGARVIAEYVSNQELRNFAFQLGVDYAQGFALGMPAPLPADYRTSHSLPTAPLRRYDSAFSKGSLDEAKSDS